MRKKNINSEISTIENHQENWLNLSELAEVEFTSENPAQPIEEALELNKNSYWQAGTPGQQKIIIHFDQPQQLTQLQLLFEENEQSRTQEFSIHWSSDQGRNYQEVVRQQFNFSPPDTSRQLENYNLNLTNATSIKLIIIPDLNNDAAKASMSYLRVR